MKTIRALLLSTILLGMSCYYGHEENKDFGWSCAGEDEYESETLANYCHSLGGVCEGNGSGPICIDPKAPTGWVRMNRC